MKKNPHLCSPQTRRRRERSGSETLKIKNKKVLEIRKGFLPLQTQTEGCLRERKKLRLSEFSQ